MEPPAEQVNAFLVEHGLDKEFPYYGNCDIIGNTWWLGGITPIGFGALLRYVGEKGIDTSRLTNAP
jgi:hypothetical protein